jgi:hypothetical protein
MSKWLIFLSGFVLLFTVSCRKDEPGKIIHSGLTRIDYQVNNPLEMPHMEFTLTNAYDLTNHTACSVTLIANENSVSLSLKIMLEDTQGNLTDQHPFIISEEEIAMDNHAHTFTYNFDGNLGSSTDIIDGVNIRRIKKVLVHINAGIEGKVSEGHFWLDKIEFSKSN